MQNIFKTFGNFMIVLILACLFQITLNLQEASAEISVDSYCRLTIQSMQQQISQTQTLMDIVNQYKDDPAALKQHLEIKRIEFDQAKASLYSSFDTTADEYVSYMSRNGAAVKEYLDANADVKKQIDDLSAELKALLEQEDEMKGGEPPAELQ